MTTNQTIDGVPREFVREGRYIVVKPDYEDDIRTERLINYIEEMCFHTPDCVVVEADWPEYEPVWRMIEARVIGNPTELDAAKATISKLQGLVAELRALLGAPDQDEYVPDGILHAAEHGAQVDAIGILKQAAQPQGEPVAYLDLEKIQPGGMAYATKMRVNHRQTALYAEQPAPVAMVLPDRGTQDGWQSLTSQDLGWNACLDEVTRLNTK